MSNTVTHSMIDMLNGIKKEETDTNIDIKYIIKLMSPYSEKELYLLKDCIDFILLYRSSR